MRPPCPKTNNKLQVPGLALLPANSVTSGNSNGGSVGWMPPSGNCADSDTHSTGRGLRGVGTRSTWNQSGAQCWQLVRGGSHPSPELSPTLCPLTTASDRQYHQPQLLAWETEAQRICKSGSGGVILKYKASLPCWVSRPDEIRLAMQERQVGP